jgi:hypothetical protein
MPQGAALAAGQPAGQAPQQQQQQGGFTFSKLAMGAAVYFGINFAINIAFQKSQTGVEKTDPITGEVVRVAANTDEIPPFQFRPKELNEGAKYRAVPKKIAPIWPQDSHVDIMVTLSPSFNPTPISDVPEQFVVFDEKRFHLNNKTDKRSIDTVFPVPPSVQNNGTLWGHFYIGLPGSKLDPREPGFDSDKAYHMAWPLTQYLPKKKVVKTRNLLESKAENAEDEPEVEEPSGPIIASHYHPNASFAFVPSLGVKEFSVLPPVVRQFVRLEATGARDATGNHGWYCTS